MENTRLTLCHRYSFISSSDSQKHKLWERQIKEIDKEGGDRKGSEATTAFKHTKEQNLLHMGQIEHMMPLEECEDEGYLHLHMYREEIL